MAQAPQIGRSKAKDPVDPLPDPRPLNHPETRRENLAKRDNYLLWNQNCPACSLLRSRFDQQVRPTWHQGLHKLRFPERSESHESSVVHQRKFLDVLIRKLLCLRLISDQRERPDIKRSSKRNPALRIHSLAPGQQLLEVSQRQKQAKSGFRLSQLDSAANGARCAFLVHIWVQY